MPANTGTFVRRINRRARNLEDNVESLRQEVAIEMITELIFSTPVDTGRARSNWSAGVNFIQPGIIEPYAPGRNLGRQETANASAAIAAAIEVITSATKDDFIFLSNNVPYIMRLNDGYSRQAGVNFIGRALGRAEQRVRRLATRRKMLS